MKKVSLQFVLFVLMAKNAYHYQEVLEYCSLYEETGSFYNISASCNTDYVIAIQNVAMKDQHSNCSEGWNAMNINFNTCCSAENLTNCAFNTFDSYRSKCNGEEYCSIQTNHSSPLSECVPSGNNNFTTNTYFEYFCVNRKDICSISALNCAPNTSATAYIWSDSLHNMSTSDLEYYNCSVEIDSCEASIRMFIVHKEHFINNISDNCTRITQLDGQSDLVLELKCLENLNETSYSFDTTYLKLFRPPSGRFWLGFEANTTANITVNCPSKQQMHCKLKEYSSATETTTINTTSTTSQTTTNLTSTATKATSTTYVTTKTPQTKQTTYNPTTQKKEYTRNTRKENVLEIAASTVSAVGGVLIGFVTGVFIQLKKNKVSPIKDGHQQSPEKETEPTDDIHKKPLANCETDSEPFVIECEEESHRLKNEERPIQDDQEQCQEIEEKPTDNIHEVSNSETNIGLFVIEREEDSRQKESPISEYFPVTPQIKNDNDPKNKIDPVQDGYKQRSENKMKPTNVIHDDLPFETHKQTSIVTELEVDSNHNESFLSESSSIAPHIDKMNSPETIIPRAYPTNSLQEGITKNQEDDKTELFERKNDSDNHSSVKVKKKKTMKNPEIDNQLPFSVQRERDIKDLIMSEFISDERLSQRISKILREVAANVPKRKVLPKRRILCHSHPQNN